MEKLKISASLVKDFVKYRNNELCGVLFDARWINRVRDLEQPKSDAMQMGQRFEYDITGEKPRDGEVPGFITTRGGSLVADQQRLIFQAKQAKKSIKENGFVIREPNKTITFDLEKFILKRIVDIEAEKKGEVCVIDLKTTGNIKGSFGEKKYSWNKEVMGRNFNQMIEVAITKLIYRFKYGIKDVPYYFYIASRKDESVAFREVVMPGKVLDFYHGLIMEYHEIMEESRDFGFAPMPSPDKCNKCPMAMKCKFKTDKVVIESIEASKEDILW